MRKQIEVHIPMIIRGYQLHLLVVCNTRKQAAELLQTSLHHLKNYGHVLEPKTKEAIEAPTKVFAYFDSGWLREKKPDLYRKVLPLEVLDSIISKENKKQYSKLFKK